MWIEAPSYGVVVIAHASKEFPTTLVNLHSDAVVDIVGVADRRVLCRTGSGPMGCWSHGARDRGFRAGDRNGRGRC